MDHDEKLLKDKNPQEQIDSSFKIRDKDNNYELNVRTNDVHLILKISEKENKFIEYFEEELTITDIQNKHKIFKSYSLFKKFVDYIESQVESNKLKILKINNESFLIRFEQENIEIILKKKTFDKEIIKKNVYNERMKYENKIINLETDNKIKDQEILNFKAKIIELKKEKEELKEDNRQLKEENQKLKEENENNNKFYIIKNIKPINLKKEESNQINQIKTIKAFSKGINTKNELYNKKLKIIKEFFKQFLENISDKQGLNGRKMIKNLSYKELINTHIFNKINPRTNNALNLSENNKKNKSIIEIKTDNINNNNDNLINKKNITAKNRTKTKENNDDNKIINLSNENERNKNNLKQIKHNISLTPIKYHHNHPNNNSNNSKKIKIIKNISNYRIKTENNQGKSNKIFNNIYRNDSSRTKENKIKNNQIINDKNNNIKHINNKLKNYAKILKHDKNYPFMHVIFQCLKKPFAKYFLFNKKEIKKNCNQLPLSNAFLEIIENLGKNKSIKKYTYNNFINIIQNQKNKLFSEPKELLNFIFDKLHQELNKVKNINSEFKEKFDGDLDKYIKNYEKYFNENYQSIISKLFYVKYNSKIICLECNEEFQENQLRNMLEFSLEKVKEYNNINEEDTKDITINNCFKYLQYFYKYNICNKCKKEQAMSYNNILFGEPKFLIINININNKIKNKLAIEDAIDLSNFFYNRKKKYNYKLESIMMYLGDDHFISFCKSLVDNNWYKYDDSKFTRGSLEEIKSQGTPYLLFYSLIEN